MRTAFQLSLLSCLLWLPLRSAAQESSLPAEAALVGNVYGVVIDAITLAPISQAEIFLLRLPLAQGSVQELIRTPLGNRTLSQLRTADKRGLTDKHGEFLINFVPTPFPGQFYLIVISSAGSPP